MALPFGCRKSQRDSVNPQATSPVSIQIENFIEKMTEIRVGAYKHEATGEDKETIGRRKRGVRRGKRKRKRNSRFRFDRCT